MTVTHRTLDGQWAECPSPESCELKFHIPDLTPEAAAAMPLSVLLPLLEVVDPPDSITDSGAKYWILPSDEDTGFMKMHRDYDLPAEITPEGSLFWWRLGAQHRGGDKPAVINSNGNLEWWEHGQAHREDGKPAVVSANGSKEWWEYGEFIRAEDATR